MNDNAPRLREGTPHVESWFIRANHPTEPKALWVKGTLLSPLHGPPVAEAWCCVFEEQRTLGIKATSPLAQAELLPQPFRLTAAGATLELHEQGGRARGSLANARGQLAWDFSLEAVPESPGAPPGTPLGAPLCMLPSRSLVDGPLPKNKLLTPFPLLKVDGWLEWNGAPWLLDGWYGMQGHNWGPAHAPKYAWGQCLFFDRDGAPHCMVEAASGKVRLGPLTTPVLSLMVIRRGSREYRFDRILDLWRQDAHIAFPEWTLRMRGSDGEAQLVMRAEPDRMVCLGYANPDGQLSYCLNSKTAAVVLRVNPVNDDPFECISQCGGALEFLEQASAPRITPVV